jgi:hypothetical protein
MKRTSLTPPRPHRTRAFISYAHADRIHGAQTKAVLEQFGFTAFLAHEDLELSAEWRDRIVEELESCQLFVPLLSERFVTSHWASQEIGYIISRPDTVIAPLSLDGTKPYGFISNLQSRRIGREGVTEEVLLQPLIRKLPRQLLPWMIYLAGEAGSFRYAEERMRPLIPLLSLFSPSDAQTFAVAAVENGQVWLAKECREEFLPEFIQHQAPNIDPATLRALKHQIEQGEWYPGDATHEGAEEG